MLFNTEEFENLNHTIKKYKCKPDQCDCIHFLVYKNRIKIFFTNILKYDRLSLTNKCAQYLTKPRILHTIIMNILKQQQLQVITNGIAIIATAYHFLTGILIVFHCNMHMKLANIVGQELRVVDNEIWLVRQCPRWS